MEKKEIINNRIIPSLLEEKCFDAVGMVVRGIISSCTSRKHNRNVPTLLVIQSGTKLILNAHVLREDCQHITLRKHHMFTNKPNTLRVFHQKNEEGFLMSSDSVIYLTNTLGSKEKHISEIKKTILRPLIQLAVKAIGQEHIEDGILDRLSEKYNLPQDKVDEWYSVVLTIFKAHLRSASNPAKIADFKECLQELKFENSCIEDLCAVLYGHKRPALIHGLTEKTKFYPTLKSCRWRIDITISSSYLSRVLEPTILMEWTLSSGQRHMFELSMAKFHLLRHTIASLLLKMQELENTIRSKAIPRS